MMDRKPYTPPWAVQIIELDPTFWRAVDANGGYCPCMVERTEDTKCPCKDFREMTEGVCHCGRYEKRRK